MGRLNAILVGVLFAAMTQGILGAEIAIVVNKENPIDEISLKDLTAIFEMKRQKWTGSEQIYLVLLKSGQAENDVVLDKIYQRSDAAMIKFWKRMQFNGLGKIPKKWSSSADAKIVVSKVQQSIGYIDAAEVDDSVKVLSVDGLMPGDDGYLLKQD